MHKKSHEIRGFLYFLIIDFYPFNHDFRTVFKRYIDNSAIYQPKKHIKKYA